MVFAMSIFMVISGTLCGLEEEAVAFYPIMCPIFIAMGYDAIVTMGVIFLAGFMGVTMSISNPFSVVIASNTAGVPFTEGVWWRIGGCIVGSAVVIGYLYWYAKKSKPIPSFPMLGKTAKGTRKNGALPAVRSFLSPGGVCLSCCCFLRVSPSWFGE